ncbi:MAG: hypothetical protein HY657_16700 [Acidobacteria bacterium]|nr:hypothetical protein [Acidobacteriota bacterium]
MRVLPRVTLVAIDGTHNPAATERSLAEAAARAAFGRVLFLSPTKAHVRPDLYERAEWIEIPPLSLKGYNQFCLAELHTYISTSHCLTVQGDSRIVNAAAWEDTWLEYDYIGAPWPPGHTGTPYRVGNSGFCLRSTALLRATSTLPRDSIVWRGKTKMTCRDDVIACVMYREHLEAQGLRFAPPDVAAHFAFELPTPEARQLTTQFGTHERRRLKPDRGG